MRRIHTFIILTLLVSLNIFGQQSKTVSKDRQLQNTSSQVVTDYQSVKEQEFVEELRRRYPVEIFKDALQTVNRH